jgi:hypothetical protein
MSTLRNTLRTATAARYTLRSTLRAFAPVLALGFAGLTVACADGPTTPAAAPAQAFIPGPHFYTSSSTTTVDVIPRLTPTSRDEVMQITVQPGGSKFTDRSTEMTVSFPAGFVSRPTTFTVTRKAGAMVGYDFEPSGTFSKPVTVTIKLDKTKWETSGGTLPVQGAYVRNWWQVSGSQANADELVPTTVDVKAKTATLTLNHFSGYLVSSGRTYTYRYR